MSKILAAMMLLIGTADFAVAAKTYSVCEAQESDSGKQIRVTGKINEIEREEDWESGEWVEDIVMSGGGCTIMAFAEIDVPQSCKSGQKVTVTGLLMDHDFGKYIFDATIRCGK